MATVNKDFVTRNGVQATNFNNVALTRPASLATLALASGKTLTVSNTLTLTGTDSSSVAFGSGGTVAYTGGNLSQFASTTSSQLAGIISDETGSGALVFGTSPAITTSLTTPSTSFDLLNTTATTINFGGGATGNINIGHASGTVVIAGNLTVNGTTTTVNSTTISVDDKNIELGSVASPDNTTADGGGITLRGATDKTFNWVNATSAWTSSEHLNLLTGKSYYINGTAVLSATALGTGVTSSSLTSVGTIGTGTWQGSLIAGQYGGTGVNNSGKTITLGGNLTTSGAFATTLTVTNTTNVTLPTTGTLATLAGSEALTGKTYNGLTLTSTTGTFTLTNAKTFAVQNSITLAGTDGTTITLPSTTGTVALNNQSFFIGTTSVAINRTSAALSLAGVSIDGSAGSLAGTNSVSTDKTVTITANATPTTIDTWSGSTYRGAEYLITMTAGTGLSRKSSIHKVIVMYDEKDTPANSDVDITEYAVIEGATGPTDASGTITATNSSGTVTVTASSATGATTNVVIKAAVTYIKA